ncbi:hypothetical protein K457DRAFT_12440 [Linnemannia elongata AG-77]|uniref:F-box domain-containing protein n=1 Tax=Linnemannia elongata AG-77 TaxID=1314771 RepID=A0A197KGD2_9FUNG|nr:hypothetical protein K457DRAFT_12440 [Linnemannia elongata AG-77]
MHTKVINIVDRLPIKIILEFGPYLNRSTLFKALRVCRLWSEILERHNNLSLTHTVIITNPQIQIPIASLALILAMTLNLTTLSLEIFDDTRTRPCLTRSEISSISRASTLTSLLSPLKSFLKPCSLSLHASKSLPSKDLGTRATIKARRWTG